MITRPLDALLRAASTWEETAPLLLRDLPPGSQVHQAIERLYQATQAFQAALASPGPPERRDIARPQPSHAPS